MRMLTTSSGGAELVAVRRGLACGQARGAASLGSYCERIRWFADAARSPWRSVEIRHLSCVKIRGPRCVHKPRSAVKCFQSYISSREPFGPKESSVRHELSSASCHMVAEPGLTQDLVSNGDRAALGATQAGDGDRVRGRMP